MRVKLIEVTNPAKGGGALNWGKFMLVQLEEAELQYKSQLRLTDPAADAVQQKFPLLSLIGYSRKNVWVFDLQTREGAAFLTHGCAVADLDSHRIWVCPMYEPFLCWLYENLADDITKLPSVVELVDAPGEWRGYRREGQAYFSDGEGI